MISTISTTFVNASNTRALSSGVSGMHNTIISDAPTAGNISLGFHEKAKVPVCPRGFSLSSSPSPFDGTPEYICRSKERYEPHITCPEGTTIVENQCVNVAMTDVTYSCPEGFERFGFNQCVAHHDCPIQTKCEEGTMDKIDGRCSVIIPKEAERVCPDGFVMIGSKCFQASVVNPRISCPVGFYAAGLDCIRKLEFDPIPVCPDATTRTVVDGVDVCEGKEFVAKDFTCISGEVTVVNGEKKCKDFISEVADFTCPPGWTKVPGTPEVPAAGTTPFVPAVSPKCTRTQEKSVDFYCDYSKGARLEWSVSNKRYECIKASLTNGTFACPTGLTEVKGRCIKSKIFDMVEVCHKKHQKLVDHMCIETAYEPLTTDCEDGNYDPINEICYVNINKDAAYVCPNGCRHIPGTSRCFCENKSEPLSYCAPGCSMVGGKCEKDDIRPAKANCPDGHGYAGQGLCEHKTLEEPERSCHEGHILQDGFCMNTKESAPSYVCPDKYVETADNRCVLHTQTPLLH